MTRRYHLAPSALAAVALTAASVAGSALLPANALLAPGTPAKDVHFGLDNDNAANSFIQPPGVTAQQHMDNTDVLVGRGNDDLLVGNLGGDTLLGNAGADILVGGPENFTAPNGDVLLGEGGDDVNIWAPGDGSDAFVGHTGYDAMIFAPFLKESDGTLRLESFRGSQGARAWTSTGRPSSPAPSPGSRSANSWASTSWCGSTSTAPRP